MVHDAFNQVQSSSLKCIEKASGVHDAFDRASIIFIKTLQIIKHRSKKYQDGIESGAMVSMRLH